ncbi:MAG: DUF485 domain-containing protein [bacterium]|nr:DUF485 domain-containing protein [bacterium]
MQPHHHLSASDWDALAADPEFRALMAARRRFIVPATIFFALFYLSLPIGLALAPRAMSAPAIGPLTLAYVVALAQFVTSWLLLALYMIASRSYDKRVERLVEKARTEFGTP